MSFSRRAACLLFESMRDLVNTTKEVTGDSNWRAIQPPEPF